MRALIAATLALVAVAQNATAQWMPQAGGTRIEYRGLSAVSPDVVWASGTHGSIAKTGDGGADWLVTSIDSGSTLDLRAIVARSATHAVALSSGPAEQGQARIFRTTDGAHWTQVYSTTQPGVFLDALAFWDDAHGIAMSDPVRGKLFLVATDDGGATWTPIDTHDAPEMLPGEAAFAASGTCIAVQGTSNVWIATGGGARARVFRSTDRGRTWSVADTPIHAGNSASGIFSIAFRDARHGVAVGGEYTKPKTPTDNVALTDDGGRTWRLARGPLPVAYLSGVAYVPGADGRNVVAVGLAGTAISRNGGDSWMITDTTAYNSVAFASQTAGWTAGPAGRLARWTGMPSPRGQR